MSARKSLDTSRFTITADDFKDELDRVLEYVHLASARCDLPMLDDLFVDPDTNRYWLLCYAIRFAARCATQRVEDIAQDIADEDMGPHARGVSSRAWSRQVAKSLRELRHLEEDTDIDTN